MLEFAQQLNSSCLKSPRGIFLGCSFYPANVLPRAVLRELRCWRSSKRTQTTQIYSGWGEMAFSSRLLLLWGF